MNSVLDNRERIVLLAVFALVFAAVFIFLKQGNAGKHEIGGVIIFSQGEPLAEFRNVLARETIVIREELFAGNDSRNSMIAIQAAQLANAFRTLGKRAFAYGVVDNRKLGCENASTQFKCENESVVVRVGECDCVRVQDGVITVEGSEDFFKRNQYANVIRITSVVAGAAQNKSAA